MPFIDNDASSFVFKNKHNYIIKSALICSAALTGIMVANPFTNSIVKADTVPTTQINTPNTNWTATKPADIHIDNNQKTYTLNRGDTLWAIAQATNTDVNQLAQLNNINLEAGDQYHLAVGLTIKLTADTQTNDNSNSNNTNTAAQNGATSNGDNNTGTTTTDNSSNTETSPQGNSTATGNQTADGNSEAGNSSTAGADNTNPTTQNSAASNSGNNNAASNSSDNTNSNSGDNNANSTTANDNSNDKTSPQGNSANTTANSQIGDGKSEAGNPSATGSDTNANTTKNGQVDPSKSQTSKPVDVIHNESGKQTSDETNPQSAVSQSSVLSDGSTSSQTPNASTNKTGSSTPTNNSSQQNTTSSSNNKTPNDNNSNTAPSNANNHSSVPANSSSKSNSSSTSNAGPGTVNISRGANSSSSNANPSSNNSQSNVGSNSNSNNSSSSSKNNNSSSSSLPSSSTGNSNNTQNTSDYKQTAPLNDDDLAKVVALEKQLNDLNIQADTVSNNLQFYQDFIDATKNTDGTNTQDRLDKIDYQNTYYQKTVDGWSNMSDEQAQLTTIKAQLPVDAQTITNLQNQLAKPNITDAEKQTLNTDLINAKATAIKDQETYQTLQADINQSSEIVAEYKALLSRNADMTAALKGNGQANNLVTQYQNYINANQKTQANLNAQIANITSQLKAYGVTLNS